jgi:hypothetical protein
MLWWIVFWRGAKTCGRHPFPLKGRVRLGHEGRGVDGDAPFEALACLQREIDNGLNVVVGSVGWPTMK